MYIACSTLCFGRQPLNEALQSIAELEFSKYEVAIHEQGCQLRPSEIADDVNVVAQPPCMGPGLMPAAFCVAIDAATEEESTRQFRAVSRLARLLAVPVITLRAAPAETGLDAEVERLKSPDHPGRGRWRAADRGHRNRHPHRGPRPGGDAVPAGPRVLV